MSKDPAFPFYAQDFLTGVMHLTMEERGQYITLLAYQWAHYEIPKKRLGLVVGLSWESLSDEIREKFTETDETVYNERLEYEREKRAIFKGKQAENGKKGGRPKKPKQNPNETQIESQTISQKKPLESENEKEDEVEINLKDAENFEVFEYADETQFLEDWKTARMKYDNLPTAITKLDFHERIAFLKIKKEYPKDTIQKAITGLFMQKGMFPSTRLRPDHFLKNIEKYLDCEINGLQLFESKNQSNGNNNNNRQPAKFNLAEVLKQTDVGETFGGQPEDTGYTECEQS